MRRPGQLQFCSGQGVHCTPFSRQPWGHCSALSNAGAARVPRGYGLHSQQVCGHAPLTASAITHRMFSLLTSSPKTLGSPSAIWRCSVRSCAPAFPPGWWTGVGCQDTAQEVPLRAGHLLSPTFKAACVGRRSLMSSSLPRS